MQYEQETQGNEEFPRRIPPQWGKKVGGTFFLSAVLLLRYRGIATTFPDWEFFGLLLVTLGGTAWGAWMAKQEEYRVAIALVQQKEERDGCWRELLHEYIIGLPVLKQQLNETAQQVEQSVIRVCDAFSGMVSRAQASVKNSETNLQGEITQSDSQAN